MDAWLEIEEKCEGKTILTLSANDFWMIMRFTDGSCLKYINGKFDVPYEMAIVSIFHGEDGENHFICIGSNLFDEKARVFAKYSTENKAKKAMEMLRERYSESCRIFTIFNGTKEFLGKTYTVKENEEISNTIDRLSYFQFPADNEMDEETEI